MFIIPYGLLKKKNTTNPKFQQTHLITQKQINVLIFILMIFKVRLGMCYINSYFQNIKIIPEL